MKILIVDDEKMMRTGMQKEVKNVLPDADIFLAESGRVALEIFGKEDISLVFLDVEMPGMNGLEVAKNLKEMRPDVNIVMTTAYPNYAVDAYRLHIGGYLMKPVDAEDIREELEHLIHPVERETDPSRLSLCCFGEFKAEFGGGNCGFPDRNPRKFWRILRQKTEPVPVVMSCAMSCGKTRKGSRKRPTSGY